MLGARSSRRLAAMHGGVLVAIVVLGFCVNAGIRLACRDGCGADIGRLYDDRGIDRAHPPYFDRDLEYPPVIGLVMYAATVPLDRGLRWKFLLNALVLGTIAVATTWLLWRRYGDRTRRWALAPPLLLEGLTNWDLLAVGPATIGLLQWDVGRAFLAGLLLGVGAAAKLYPALFVPMLVASCIPTRAWLRARDVILGALSGFLVFVVPVYGAAPHALRHLVDFHRVRVPISTTFWYYIFRNPDMHQWLSDRRIVSIVNPLVAILLAASLALIFVYTARGRLGTAAACALATTAFIVTNKIYSPQYDLWLVPFFVMVPVRTKLVVHFYVSSFLVWLLTATENHVLHRPASLYVLAAGVAYRLVVEALLARDFVRFGAPVDMLADRA